MSERRLPSPLQPEAKGWPWTEVVDSTAYDPAKVWPSISVLVPSYNQGQYLEECLRSVLAQQYPDIEILLADGGSTDTSAQVIAHYAPHLAWHRIGKDAGTWDANNMALAQAKGEYVLVLNSDDYLLPKGLLHLVNGLAGSPNKDWVTGKVWAVDTLGATKATFNPKPWPDARPGRSFLQECWIYHPSTLLRRSLIGQFAETDLMDWELWIRLERQGLVPAVVPCPIAALRFHASSKSYNSANIYRSQLKLLVAIAQHYPDGLAQEIAAARRRIAEAQMCQYAENQAKGKALAMWVSWGLQNPHLLIKRPYLGLGKRLATGNLHDLYKPLAFLDQPYQPGPADELCG